MVKTENNAETKYVYGLGLIGEEVSGSFKVYHFDYRGSTVAITDSNCNITDTFEYDTYGKLKSRTGTTKTPFLYNGRDGVMYEEDTGLIYMRARYYSPELRRFINADKVHGDITNALTLNRYAFVNGNPAVNVDPLGLKGVDARGGSNTASSIKKPLDWSRATPEEMNQDIWEYIKEESKVGDGEYALIDNYRNQVDGIFHEQFFIVNVNENKTYVSLNQETSIVHEFKSASFELTKGEWNFEKASIGVFNFIDLSASFDLENGFPEVGASVSIWNPEFSIKTKYGTIHAEINVGCFEFGTISYLLSKILGGDLKSPLVNLNIDIEKAQ